MSQDTGLGGTARDDRRLCRDLGCWAACQGGRGVQPDMPVPLSSSARRAWRAGFVQRLGADRDRLALGPGWYRRGVPQWAADRLRSGLSLPRGNR